MRISIKKHNRAFIERIAAQMEINDYSEVINYLVLELKRLNYSFNSLSIHSAPPLQDIPYDNQFDALSIPVSVDDTRIDSLPSETIDPIIERLVSLGLCEQNF